jgi:hypothetical protein
VVVALYVVATSAGAGSGSGSSSGDPRQGLPEALGRVLVQPAGSGDLSAPADASACRRGDVLTVPAGGECAYRLSSGFLARRLRLRLTTPGDPVTAALDQPKPRVTDTETLDASHPEVELTYRQEHSTLTLTCPGKNPCVVQVR